MKELVKNMFMSFIYLPILNKLVTFHLTKNHLIPAHFYPHTFFVVIVYTFRFTVQIARATT